MKVALLTREFPPNIYGGAGVHVGALAAALAPAVTVEVHAFAADEPAAPGVTSYAPWPALTEIAGTDPIGTALGVMSVDLAMVAGLGTPDVCHSHTWYANLAGHLAHVALGIPHVATVHSLEPLRPWKVEQLGAGYALSSWCEQTALENADAIIAVSHAMAADVLRCYPAVKPERVEVIHNGVDTTLWHPVPGHDVLDRYGIDPTRPIVLFVGRITRQKGLAHLLRAAPAIDARAQIVVCGGAPDTEAIAQETAALADSARKRAGGLVLIDKILAPQEIAQFYSHAAAFVCPSIYEPFGLVNVEAMACGAPVVATAVGGIPEIVVDGETGLLVPVTLDADGNPTDDEALAADLAAAVNALLADAPRRRAFGAAGRLRVEEHFAWPTVAARTVELYRRVVDA